MDVRVISIGALARHPLWGEREETRTGHATTTLIRTGEMAILVDPGLPGPAVAARLAERSGLHPSDVTHVFLTSFRPEVFRGITAFDGATWLISEAEREITGAALAEELRRMADDEAEAHGGELRRALERDAAILRRCRVAPDCLTGRSVERVDLFPLPGVTPGLTGLLIPEGNRTTLVCGDAIATVEHLEQGKVLPQTADLEHARESFREAVEIADLLVLGRDNMVVNPGRRWF